MRGINDYAEIERLTKAFDEAAATSRTIDDERWFDSFRGLNDAGRRSVELHILHSLDVANRQLLEWYYGREKTKPFISTALEILVAIEANSVFLDMGEDKQNDR